MVNVTPAGAGVTGPAIYVGGTIVGNATNGYLLYNNNGVLGNVAISGITPPITVGSTVINGGTSGRMLYDNAGIVGETVGLTWNGSVLTAPAGTSVLPSVTLGDSGTGLFRPSADRLGIASSGKTVLQFSYRSVSTPDGQFDNARSRWGTDQAIASFSNSQETYVATLDIGQHNISGANAAVIGFNIGQGDITATDAVTKINPSFSIEVDALFMHANNGNTPVTFNFLGGTRSRIPVIDNYVNIVNAVAYSFAQPTVSGLTSAGVTNYIGYHVPAMTGGMGTNYFGMLFDNTPNKGSIASIDFMDLTLNAGAVAGTQPGDVVATGQNVILNTRSNGVGGGGNVLLEYQGNVGLRIASFDGSSNFRMGSGGTPFLRIEGSGTNIGMGIQSKGTGSITFSTAGGNDQQVLINATASPTTQLTLNGGSSSNNPRVGSNGNQLVLGSNTALATNATAGFIQIPSCAGTPTGTPTNSSNGPVTLVYDTANDKLYVYNGSWKASAAFT